MRKIVIKNNTIKTGSLLLLVLCLFMLVSVVLTYQRDEIGSLDCEIRAVDAEIKKAMMINDDLEAELLNAVKLDEIQEYAVKELGMVKATEKNNTYVAYNANTSPDNEVESDVAVGFFSKLFK